MDEDAYDDENSQFLVDDIVDELKKRDIDWAKFALVCPISIVVL